MTREEAEKYAKEITYRDAIYNALQGKCIPYRKATLIKLYELLDMVELQEVEKINCKITKCENCKNHNYCDYELQERGE